MGTDIFDMNGTIGDMPGVGSQKTLHMIFVVDNSGSMRNENRMDAVNTAFRQMIPELQRIQSEVQDNFTIMISIMAFNEDPEWITTPTEISYYVHNEIPASQYVTYFSRAFDELNMKLSRSQFINQRGKIAAPYIMLLTDGAPTEGDDYETTLNSLKSNGWFAASQRYAVLIGEDTINDPNARQAVSSFVNDNGESIINAADAAMIVSTVSAKTIHVVEQMTQRKGGNIGDEIKKGNSQEMPFPGPDPTPFPEPIPGMDPNPFPFPGSDPNPFPEQWPVLPTDDPKQDDENGLPDPNAIFDPNLIF